MNYHKELIRISEFSKLCGVTKQTLIYYDKVELFKPYFINEKGYRFYTLDQHSLFFLIKTLKDLGTSLDEIKEYIDNKNSKKLLGLLKNNKEKVDEQIKHLKSISKSIDRGIEKIKEGEINYTLVSSPKIESVDQEYICISEVLSCDKTLNIVKGIFKLNEIAKNSRIQMPNIHGIVKKSKLLNNTKDFDISHLYIKTYKKNNQSIIKPQGKYAIIYHKGSFDETYKSYEKLLAFIKINNLEIKGDSYEETVLDIKTEKEDIFLVKISIFIDKI